MSMEILETARQAARAGAEVLRAMWGRQLKVELKGKADFVTEADRKSEQAVLARIRASYPDHLILAEESAADWSRETLHTDQVLWVVDPLDGTTNFIHGHPPGGGERGRPAPGQTHRRGGDRCDPEGGVQRLRGPGGLAGPEAHQGQPQGGGR